MEPDVPPQGIPDDGSQAYAAMQGGPQAPAPGIDTTDISGSAPQPATPGLPDVGPAPEVAQDTVGQGFSKLGSAVGQGIQEGWQNFKNSTPVRKLSELGSDANPAAPPGSPQAKGPNRVASMVMGEGAAPLTALRETAKAVDPHNTQPPGNQNLMAIDAEVQKGNLKGATALLQANRLAWGSQQAFALSAINGGRGQPPDLNAAIDAANKAEQHIVDGSNIKFSHAGNGKVTATVMMATGGEPQTIPLTVDQFRQFLNIKDNHWDKLMQDSVPATLQRIASSRTSAALSSQPIPQGAPPKGASAGTSAPAGASASAGTSAGTSGDEERDDDEAADYKGVTRKEMKEEMPGITGMNRNNNNGNGIKYVRKGTRTPVNPAAGTGTALGPNDNNPYNGGRDSMGRSTNADPIARQYEDSTGTERTKFDDKTDDELTYRANRMFPPNVIGNEKARQEWITGQQEKDAERKNKLDTEVLKGDNAEKIWKARGATATTVQGLKNEGAQGVADTRAKVLLDRNGKQLQGKQLEAAAKQEAAAAKHSEFLMDQQRKSMTASQATLGKHFNAMHNNPLHEWTPEDLAEEKAWQAEVTKGIAGPRAGAPAVPTGQAAPPPTSVTTQPTGQGAAAPVSKADLEAEMRRRGHLQ